jgi:hypothetical protein
MMVWKILPIVKLGIVVDMFGNCEIRGGGGMVDKVFGKLTYD